MDLQELDLGIHDLLFVPGVPRTPGLHLSDILKSIMVELDPRTYDTGKPMNMLAIECGFSFERALEEGFQSRREDIFRPGEIVKDGVICSPDGIYAPTWRVEEFKFTKKSSREAPLGPKFLMWRLQIMAYCFVLQAFTARLVALFVNDHYPGGSFGDYRLRAWLFTFDAVELASNWQMLLTHAREKGMLR